MRKDLTLLAGALALIAACSTDKADQTTTDSAAGSTATAAAPAKPALDDPTIVAIFDVTNSVDIETGQLAVERGSTREVRDFGAMLARDHKMVQQQGRD